MVRGGLFRSCAVLVIATLASTPAFAAKSDSKKSKPKETRMERDRGEPFDTRFALFYGNKSLDKNDWAPLEKQSGFGVEAEFAKSDWPASAVVTYFTSDGSKTEKDSTSMKTDLQTVT
jgi:hypothetical protein